jgi:hypothetical protein
VLLIAAAAVELSADDRQTNRFSAAPSTVAGEQTGQAECAARDLKLLTSIEQHAKRRTFPPMIVAAFFTLAKARKPARPAIRRGACNLRQHRDRADPVGEEVVAT